MFTSTASSHVAVSDAMAMARSCEAALFRAGRGTARRAILASTDSVEIGLLLRNKSRVVRLKALYMVGMLHISDLCDDVCDMLANDSCPVVRHEAAYQLGTLHHSNSLGALCNAMLNDSEEIVRHEAAEALGEMGNPAAIPFLSLALLDSAASVRATAEIALEELAEHT
jgi:HEAT repeat protein